MVSIMGNKSSKDNDVANTYKYVTSKDRKKLLKQYPNIDFDKIDRLFKRCINVNADINYIYHTTGLTDDEQKYIRSNGHRISEMHNALNDSDIIYKIYVNRESTMTM